MGKGFQNFMSKKDFHPSAWWNLKKKWELEQNEALKKKREDEMRAQYEKEQDVLNNRALLGDEKARLGLAFMYDAPTGINRKREEGPEPKFEWQRKYNAPREEWAKGNELIQDQPFGIQVRNVRCVKCRTWGHLNTDRECPLYGMSGNADNPGYANNPSDLIKQMRTEQSGDIKPSTSMSLIKTETKCMLSTSSKIVNGVSTEYSFQEMEANDSKDALHSTTKTDLFEDAGWEASADALYEAEAQAALQPVDQDTLLENMREEHNLRLKTGVLMGVRAEEGIRKLTAAVAAGSLALNATEEEDETEDRKPSMHEFLNGLSDRKRQKLMNKIKKENLPHLGAERKKKKDKKNSRDKSTKKPTFEEFVAEMSEKTRMKLLNKAIKKERSASPSECKSKGKEKKSHRDKKSKKHKKESRKRKHSSSSSTNWR